MRKLLIAFITLLGALPVQATVTIYTTRQTFLDGVAMVLHQTAVQQDFPTPSGLGEIAAPPVAIGNASIFADQMFLYNDGSYGPTVFLGASGLPGQAGITRVTSGDAFLGFDLGSLFADAGILYNFNGSSGLLNVTDDGETFLGVIDSSGAPIVGQFVQGPDDELDFLHVYTSDNSPPPGSDVPEPASWTMMIGGLMGTGIMLRRQRRRAVAV